MQRFLVVMETFDSDDKVFLLEWRIEFKAANGFLISPVPSGSKKYLAGSSFCQVSIIWFLQAPSGDVVEEDLPTAGQDHVFLALLSMVY